MFFRDDFVKEAAQHEDGKGGWYLGYLGCGPPLLCAEEGEYADVRPAADDVREGGECVLDNERGNLLRIRSTREKGKHLLWNSSGLLSRLPQRHLAIGQR